MRPFITADEVTSSVSDAVFDTIGDAWNIVAPFAGAALVIFFLVLLIRNIAGRRR
jgi:hypothetical protein